MSLKSCYSILLLVYLSDHDNKQKEKYFNKKSIIINNPRKALKYAKKIASNKDLILVTGSIFLVGELLWKKIGNMI